MTKPKVKVYSDKEELIAVVLDFYSKHPTYRMSQNEFVGLISALSMQMMSDV